ncbi:MAG: flagellar basal body-associated FliL family protein [Terriglobales bacterium]
MTLPPCSVRPPQRRGAWAAIGLQSPAAAAQPQPPPTARTSPTRRLTRCVLGLAASVGLALGAGGCSLRHAHASSAPAARRSITALLTLKPFLVNLADPGGTAYLRTSIALGLTAAAPPAATAAPVTASVRDAIISILATSTSAQLLSPQGKAQLKQRLLQAVRERAPALPVRTLYFTGFLIQR